MSDYGVQKEGYARRPLAVILADIEERFIEIFGEGVIQTAQSPFGQLNGLEADLLAEVDERNLDLYQSYDPDQAEGTRLDTLMKLRLMERNGRSDPVIRQALTNKNEARIDIADLENALYEVEGVTFAKAYINDTEELYDEGLQRGTMAVVVLGGSARFIGEAMRRHVAPGIPTRGNALAETNHLPVCRSFNFYRPSVIDVNLSVTVVRRTDKFGCPPPSLISISEAIAAGWLDARSNNVTPDFYQIRKIVECEFQNVEVTSVVATREGSSGGQPVQVPAEISFTQIADIVSDNVTVTE